MKIFIHDFAGHPFQLVLSRELADRGHEVTHAFFAEDPGPKGVMESYLAREGFVDVLPISVGYAYPKGKFLKRLFCDILYRAKLARAIKAKPYDVVISSNTPTWVQGKALQASRCQASSFVYWCQDFYSIAVGALFKKKLGVIGRLVEFVLFAWDRHQIKKSDHVINITDAFSDLMAPWCDTDKITEINNWGAIDAFQAVNTSKDWAQINGLPLDRPIITYSGTLGLKHDPQLIIQAAEANREACFLVVAAGMGADILPDGIYENLKKLPLQPFEEFPGVLAASDILIAMIEPEAGSFSVPSKVLSYLCAGKPTVLSAPRDNLAAKIVVESGAGIVVDPGNGDGFVAAIRSLLGDSDMRERMGLAGRAYAETHFDIGQVADKFETVFSRLKTNCR